MEDERTMTNDFDLFSILPAYSDLPSRERIDVSTRITRRVKAELPIMASPMSAVTETKMAVEIAKLGGIGVIHRYLTASEQANMVALTKKTLDADHYPDMQCVGAAIASNNKDGRVDAVIKAGADFLVGDVANGWTQASIDLLRYIRKTYGDVIQIISGNIATEDAARELYSEGIDGLRVGIGGGSVCITRQVAGVGRNQLAAIKKIHEAVPSLPLISCGGIRYSGDIVKALAAGAESVIIGRLFAACDESPAPRLADGQIIYSGMASYFSEQMRVERTKEDPSGIFHLTTPEGKQDMLKPAGPLKDVVARLVGGLRAGMGYLGARTIQELQERAIWEDEMGRKVDWL